LTATTVHEDIKATVDTSRPDLRRQLLLPVLTGSGQSVRNAEDVKFPGQENNKRILEVGSGTYNFIFQIPSRKGNLVSQ
jgi:hypothetical protein